MGYQNNWKEGKEVSEPRVEASCCRLSGFCERAGAELLNRLHAHCTVSLPTFRTAEQQSELVKTFDAIVQKEHQHAHIQEWEFIDPKFEGSGK